MVWMALFQTILRRVGLLAVLLALPVGACTSGGGNVGQDKTDEPVAAVTPVPGKPAVEEDPVEALPKISKPAPPPQPQLTVKMAPPRQITTIEKPKCEPTESWKKTIQGDISDMTDKVIKNTELYKIADVEGRRVDQLAARATSASDCAVAQEAFDKLKSRLGF